MFLDEMFQKVIYLEGATAVTGNDGSPGAPFAFVDGDLWAIPADCLIEHCFVIIDVGITGTAGLDVGDDDDPDGYVDSSLSIADLSVAGMYGYDAKLAGAYLRVQTAGATDAGDIYVVPAAKYYTATGKELKLDITTANTAGKARVVVRGALFSGNDLN